MSDMFKSLAAVPTAELPKWLAFLKSLDSDVLPKVEAMLQETQDPAVAAAITGLFPTFAPLLALEPKVLSALLFLQRLEEKILALFPAS